MKLKWMVSTAMILLVTISACSFFVSISPTPSAPTEQPTVESPTKTNAAQPQPETVTATSMQPPAETPTVEVLPTETDTPWPTIAPEPAAPAHLSAGTKIQLDEIRMITQVEGWGISGGLLLKTADGGNTWREVTPVVAQADAINGAFLDGQTAWLVFSTSGQINNLVVIYHTTDGGLTWTYNKGGPIYTQVVGDTTWAIFAALDASNIWMMIRGVYMGAGTHYNHELFQTTDGGATWTSQDGEISDDYTGMVFADPNFGIRTLQTAGFYGPGAPTYDATLDGGVTWQSRELPPPPGTPDLFNNYPYCETYQPVLLSTQSIRLLMGCFDYNTPPVQFTSYIYSSQDGGSTWTTVHLPAKVIANQDTLFFFDDNNALLLGKDIYRSIDGGQTWTYIQSVSWEAQLTFMDPLHGWATGGSTGEKALVMTIDGGKKWTLIKPVTR